MLLPLSTNPWFNQVYPTGWFAGQANLDVPWPRQNVLESKRSFYPRLYIPAQGNYDRPTWYGESCAHCTKEPEKKSEGKSVNREKHEKGKMTEDSNTHGSEETSEWKKDVYSRKREKGSTMYMQKNRKSPEDR